MSVPKARVPDSSSRASAVKPRWAAPGNRKVRTIIFGAGTDCARLLERGLQGEEIVGLVDNDSLKHGTTRYGMPVFGPTALRELPWDQIRIASSETATIRSQLLSLGVPEDRIVCPLLAPANRRRLESWRGLHRGQTAVIVGNGPSLRMADLDALAATDVVTFAFNKIYLAYDRTAFRPSYYMVEDDLMAENNAARIDALRGRPKVMRDMMLRWLTCDEDTVLYGMTVAEPGDGKVVFSEDPLDFGWGASVTYTALQLAFYMGFSTVYLTGIDFAFAVPENDPGKVFRAGSERNHFLAEYRQPGERWNRPRPDVMLPAYEAARAHAQQTRRKIINATRGGALDVFPRVDFDTAFPPARAAK